MYGHEAIWDFDIYETKDLKRIQEANDVLAEFNLENEEMAAEVNRELEARGEE